MAGTQQPVAVANSAGAGFSVCIERRALAELQPAPAHPRIISDAALQALRHSINRFGLVQLIIVNKRTGEVVAGHQRLRVLKELGHREAQVVLVDLPEAEACALSLTLNNPACSGEFSDEVRALVEEIAAAIPDAVPELRLDSLLGDLDAQAPLGALQLTDPDALPEPENVPAISQPGMLFALGQHRLLCGDATDPAMLQRLLDGNQLQLVVTSPPYDNQRTYEIGEIDWDSLMIGMHGAVAPWLASDGSMLFVLGMVHERREVKLYWQRWLQHCKSDGWPLFGLYVWDKGTALPGDHHGRLGISHEFIFHLSRTRPPINKWITTAPDSRTADTAGKRFRQRDGSLKDCTSPERCGQALKVPDSVIRVTCEHRHGIHTQHHPAVYPVDLPAFILRTWSQPGAAICDPFVGSGTTIIAAEQLGRCCFCMELSAHYCDVAIYRWEQFTGSKAVLLETG